jgi:hypothetical protein
MNDIVPHLSEFDRLLAHGPYYEKLAMQGAIAGSLVSLFSGKPEARGNLGHAVTYAIAGTGLAIGGAFVLFQFGKFVSDRSHEAVSGEFAGWRGGRGRFGRGQQGQQQFGQQDGDDDQQPPPQQWHPHHHGHGRW